MKNRSPQNTLFWKKKKRGTKQNYLASKLQELQEAKILNSNCFFFRAKSSLIRAQLLSVVPKAKMVFDICFKSVAYMQASFFVHYTEAPKNMLVSFENKKKRLSFKNRIRARAHVGLSCAGVSQGHPNESWKLHVSENCPAKTSAWTERMILRLAAFFFECVRLQNFVEARQSDVSTNPAHAAPKPKETNRHI